MSIKKSVVYSLFSVFVFSSNNVAFAMNLNQQNDNLSLQKEIQDQKIKGIDLVNLSQSEVIEKLAPLFQRDQERSGILASVSMAQFILESNWGKSLLSKEGNNLFGMKKVVSNNTWEGSVWTGMSVQKWTTEHDSNGTHNELANFRGYSCIEESIEDHSAYLKGAMKENGEKRYPNISNCTDYKTAFQIIKDGGYATDPGYVKKLCDIVEKWDLTRFDKKVK